MNVRAAAEDDVPALAALERASFGGAAWSPASVQAELERAPESRHVVVAEDAGVVLGWGVLLLAGDAADIVRVAVKPARRRRGLGRLLVCELLGEASRRGCATVLLEVARENEAAKGLYESAGFRVIAERRDYYGPKQDALVMSLVGGSL